MGRGEESKKNKSTKRIRRRRRRRNNSTPNNKHCPLWPIEGTRDELIYFIMINDADDKMKKLI